MRDARVTDVTDVTVTLPLTASPPTVSLPNNRLLLLPMLLLLLLTIMVVINENILAVVSTCRQMQGLHATDYADTACS